MQKVERQKHENRRHRRLTWVLLCAAALVLCVGLSLLLRKQAAQPSLPVREDFSGTLVSHPEEEFLSVTVKQKGKTAWTAERDPDGGLRVKGEDGDYPVDESLAALLTSAASNLTYEDVFSDSREEWEPEREELGLADPEITAVFRYTDGTEITVQIGSPADPEEQSVYYMSADGDERLFAVGAGTVEDLRLEEELLHPVRQPEIYASLLDRITVKNGDGTVRTEWALQGKITDRDAAENWRMTVPCAYPADYDMIKNLRETAENLRLGVYVGEADAETLKACGLEEPAAVLEFHMSAGSTGTVSEAGVYDVVSREERTETLVLGGERSDVTAYVLYGNEIYTASRIYTDAFLKDSGLTTLARYLVATPLNSLEAVIVEKTGQETVHYALVREDGETEVPSEEETDFRCLRNGEEISPDVFSAAWERLLTVTVSGRLPEGFVPGEAHTKYTFRTVSGRTHRVELCDFDGVHDAVTLDGDTLFYLIRGGMTDLPEPSPADSQ